MSPRTSERTRTPNSSPLPKLVLKPLRAHSEHHISLSSPPPATRKSRSRTKPAGLFIHPNNSNLARADAVAVELGLHGSTEHVSAPRMSTDSEDNGTLWDHDRGRDAARALLGGTKKAHTGVRTLAKSDSQQRLFQVGDSGSESDD